MFRCFYTGFVFFHFASLFAQEFISHIGITPVGGTTLTSKFSSSAFQFNAITVSSDHSVAYIAGNGNLYKAEGLSSDNPIVTPLFDVATGVNYRGIALSTDDSTLYFTGGSTIYTCPITGSPITEVITHPEGYQLVGIVVEGVTDSSTFGYIAAGGGGGGEDRVYRINLTTGAPEDVQEWSNNQSYYYGLAISSDKTKLYASTAVSFGSVYFFLTSVGGGLPNQAPQNILNVTRSYGNLAISDDGGTLYMSLTPGSNIYSAPIPPSGEQSTPVGVIDPPPPFISASGGISLNGVAFAGSYLYSIYISPGTPSTSGGWHKLKIIGF